jgi:putative transcriptional regulator
MLYGQLKLMKKPRAIKQPQVGQFIRELRLLTELTQEEFAVNLGVTVSTVNRWENGHISPSPIAMKQIEALVQAMGDSANELLAKYLAN